MLCGDLNGKKTQKGRDTCIYICLIHFAVNFVTPGLNPLQTKVCDLELALFSWTLLFSSEKMLLKPATFQGSCEDLKESICGRS